jgi:hypothetical protein
VVGAKWLLKSIGQYRILVGSEEPSLGTQAYQDMCLGEEELNLVKSSELAAAE